MKRLSVLVVALLVGIASAPAFAGFVCWNPGAIKQCASNTGANCPGTTYAPASVVAPGVNASLYPTVSFPSSPALSGGVNKYMAQGTFAVPMDDASVTADPGFTSVIFHWLTSSVTTGNNVKWCFGADVRTGPTNTTTVGLSYSQISGDPTNDFNASNNCSGANAPMNCCTGAGAGATCGGTTAEICGSFHPYGVTNTDQYSTINSSIIFGDTTSGISCTTSCQGKQAVAAFIRDNTVTSNDGTAAVLLDACGIY